MQLSIELCLLINLTVCPIRDALIDTLAYCLVKRLLLSFEVVLPCFQISIRRTLQLSAIFLELPRLVQIIFLKAFNRDLFLFDI